MKAASCKEGNARLAWSQTQGPRKKERGGHGGWAGLLWTALGNAVSLCLLFMCVHLCARQAAYREGLDGHKDAMRGGTGW